ncbi:MAG TPA: MaoC family dehydratase N-terminal domain-containing protein, partial [Acidimicrobiales bacterium]
MAAERFPVEEGHVLMFARAIGDAEPALGDPGAEVLAPPTFVMASAQFDPDYPLRPRPGRTWFGSGGTPSGRTAGGSG